MEFEFTHITVDLATPLFGPEHIFVGSSQLSWNGLTDLLRFA